MAIVTTSVNETVASMVVLALLKLQNVETFSSMFLNYDFLAKRWVPYSYIAGALTWLSAPVALFIGTVDAVSVFKAVNIDKPELKCACVGGSSTAALDQVSMTVADVIRASHGEATQMVRGKTTEPNFGRRRSRQKSFAVAV